MAISSADRRVTGNTFVRWQSETADINQVAEMLATDVSEAQALVVRYGIRCQEANRTRQGRVVKTFRRWDIKAIEELKKLLNAC